MCTGMCEWLSVPNEYVLISISLDINECNVLNGSCSHFCNNTNGSYYCSCPMGYELVNEVLCVGKYSWISPIN